MRILIVLGCIAIWMLIAWHVSEWIVYKLRGMSW